MTLLFLLAAFSMPAAGGVTLASNVFVERVQQGPDGRAISILESPKAVTKGDRLIFVLSYKNEASEPATDFVVTNPVPDAVAFAGADDSDADVSVDWGRTWGKLQVLAVRSAKGGSRPAEAADVTHVRWSIRRPVAAGESGEVRYHAVAR